MSINEERELAAGLHEALDELDAPPLALHTVVRRGRAVKVRRRVAATALAAGVIAAAVSAPALITHLSRLPPSNQRPHYRVSVFPPGPGSPKGLIAYGRINGQRWHVSGWRSPRYGVCFGGVSSACSSGPPARASHRGNPVAFISQDGDTPQFDVATVRADVTYLRLSLRSGQQLTLDPVSVFGPGYARYVAVALPDAAAVTRVTAYSAHGEIGYAVPFTARGSLDAKRWLRPGQPAFPRRATYKIGSGVAAGRRWAEYIYAGPWGACVGGTGGASSGYECWAHAIRVLTGRNGSGEVAANTSDTGTSFIVLKAVPPASYVIVRKADGSTSRAPLVRVGAARLCAIASVKGDRTIAWAAYSAAGVRVASGRF